MEIIKISINRKKFTATIRSGARRGEILTNQPSLWAIEDWAIVFDGHRPAIRGRDEEWWIINK